MDPMRIVRWVILSLSAAAMGFGLLIMIGLWTRWAAFITCGQMAYAYWTVHATNALLPIVNRGEMAMLYCFLFLFISAKGSGVFSVDYLWGKKTQEVLKS